jgi:hypothetical protein
LWSQERQQWERIEEHEREEGRTSYLETGKAFRPTDWRQPPPPTQY